MTLDEQIDMEIKLYVSCCRSAAKHDIFENLYLRMAHVIFYHIQEMRSTGKQIPWIR
jgi:hypothetical protein